LLSIRAYIFFFSALSAEKRKISPANSATLAKRAVNKTLSLTRQA